jgi:hypothetical protein
VVEAQGEVAEMDGARDLDSTVIRTFLPAIKIWPRIEKSALTDGNAYEGKPDVCHGSILTPRQLPVKSGE